MSEAIGLDRGRRRWALILNVIAPGSGLVVLRRDWLGLSVAMLFTLFAQLAIWGLLVVPESLAAPLSVGAGVAAFIVWISAQWLGWSRARTILGSEARRELANLCDRAAEALDRGRFPEARDLLRLALTVDDEDVMVRIHWAELMTMTGRFREARGAWKSVIDLDLSGQHRQTAMEALHQMREL